MAVTQIKNKKKRDIFRAGKVQGILKKFYTFFKGKSDLGDRKLSGFRECFDRVKFNGYFLNSKDLLLLL